MTTRNKRILLTGATGFVGQRLCRDLSGEFDLHGTVRRNFSGLCEGWTAVPFEAETDSPDLLVEEVGPDAVIHCLAIARGEPCVENPDLARLVNVSLTRELGLAAREHGIQMIFTSTDQVFEGRKGDYTEEDLPRANGVYAQTKIDAERALGEVFSERPELLTVFRLALSYGWSDDRHPGPVGWIVQALQMGKAVTLFRDEIRSPLYVEDIGRAMSQALREEIHGLFHLAGREAMDRHTLGVLVARKFGLDESLCLSRSVADHVGPEPRSPNCSLSVEKFRQRFGWSPCGVEEGLERMRQERGTASS